MIQEFYIKSSYSYVKSMEINYANTCILSEKKNGTQSVFLGRG